MFPSPTPQVFVDEGGYYGAASGAFNAGTTALTYGTDFTVQWDQEDGTSRSGIVVRIGDVWPKPSVRQRGYLSPYVWDDTGSVKVVYTAGHTVDTIPAQLRMAAKLLVARLRYLFPLGMELGSESYEERSIGLVAERDNYILSVVKPMIHSHRNWKW